ncbi:hypothetical protein CYMTET_45601 [Cymbomonas tetramitiformis]|uniref:Uncharacterized protein n=1 Tax=Cymbomonas tetramitiformis TaxID=36881 RepID=A0AAE0BZA4_9CHLO|nr:hypothetical protein CYMTET_45601 [Cymbomonas tetramitiformis]
MVSHSKKATCRICHKEVRKDYMETHLKKKHGATLTKEAPPISSIFKRSGSNTVDAAGEPLPTSTDQNEPGNEDLDPASNPLKRARVSMEDQSTSLSDEAPASRTGLATVVQVLSILTMLTNMRLENTELRTSINDLPNLVAKAVATQLEPAAKTSASLLSVKHSVRHCNTVEAIIETFHMTSYPADEVFVCKVCFKHSSLSPKQVCSGVNRKSVGIFSSNSLLKNVKPRIITHYTSAVHEWCSEYENKQQLAITQQRAIGLTLGRLALETIVEAHSYCSYERAVLRQHLIGTRVGNLNHGRDFVRKLLPCFYNVVVRRVIAWFRALDPATLRVTLFALNADKVTEFRRTGQVVGAIGFDRGELKAILLGDPPVTEGHDGEGVATNIFKVLQDVYCFTVFQLRAQLTRFAFDGQYFGLDVPSILCRKIGTSVSWTMPGWDGGHRTELVLGDVRKDEVLTWYKELPEILSQIQSKFAYGKKLREASRSLSEVKTEVV